MLRIPVICIREKQAFIKERGILRMMGKPNDVARDLAAKGHKLIHIIDTQAKGKSPNFDVYNSLTYFINIQVECGTAAFAKSMLGIKSRIVVSLPASFDLREFSGNERLVVGMAGAGFTGSVEGVHDLIITDATDAAVERFYGMKKRLIVRASDYAKLGKDSKEKIWGVLEY